MFEIISYNCDVSDAKYWGFFSVCNLLLRLRELFKVERSLEPWDSISNDEILLWIEKKESVWKELENAEFKPFSLNGQLISPFDVQTINSFFMKNKLVYGAGYALYMKPSFFLGTLKKYIKYNGYEIYFVGQEIIRDLFSSPGMSIDNLIFIRLSDIKIRLWEHLLMLNSKKEPLADIIFNEIPPPSRWCPPYREFDTFVDIYSEIVMLHEVAECNISNENWKSVLSLCKDYKMEQVLRAVKDFLSDFSEEGPIKKAIEREGFRSISLYLVTIGVYQSKIFKPVFEEIKKSILNKDLASIEEIRQSQYNRWLSISEDILSAKDVQQLKNLTDEIFNLGSRF
ncbi:Sfum_1244 family protein [Thermodesulfovibrio hydrogeniphilus]